MLGQTSLQYSYRWLRIFRRCKSHHFCMGSRLQHNRRRHSLQITTFLHDYFRAIFLLFALCFDERKRSATLYTFGKYPYKHIPYNNISRVLKSHCSVLFACNQNNEQRNFEKSFLNFTLLEPRNKVSSVGPPFTDCCEVKIHGVIMR